MTQGAKRKRVGITLPDHVDVAHRHIDNSARADFPGDVVQHAVAQIDRIIETKQTPGRPVLS